MEGRLSGVDNSLNTKIGESSEDEWQSLLADEGPSPEDIVTDMKDAETRSRWLKKALGTLDEREQLIIRERHLNDNEIVTLEDLGKELGISKERVRQLESRAMDKLKHSLSSQGNATALL